MNGRKILGYVIAGLLVLLIAVLVVSIGRGGDDGADGGDTAAPPPDRGDCVAVNIAASSEKASLMQVIADGYNATDPAVGDECVYVAVQSVSSGAGEQALAAGWDEQVNGPYPTVWSPASSLWVKLLETQKPGIIDGTPESVVNTPVVFAMPRPMAEAMGWPDTPIGWKTITELAADPQGWARYGHPEWGAFTLGKTHPDYSTSGLSGTIGEYYAATGLTSDLKVTDIDDPAVQQTVSDTEQAVTHYGDTTLTFLNNQYEQDKKSSIPYVSATVVEEKSVFDYNVGNPTGKQGQEGEPPRVPLVAVQPAEGTMYSDSPYAILNTDWVTDVQKQGAQDFYAYLTTPESLEAFTGAGFRTPSGELSAELQNDPNFTTAAPTTVFSAPAGDVIAAIQASWKDLRKKSHLMMVLDISGSMDEDAGDGQSKLQKATQAIVDSLDEFNPEDEVGFAVFTSDLESAEQGIYLVLIPVGPMSENAQRIRDTAAALIPLNATPLYNTTLLAQQQAVADFQQDRINAVVVLTDGRNEYDGSISLEQLLGEITATNENRNKTVKVFTIGYGEDADMATLETISSATGAAAYDATDPANIEKVLTSVMSNF